MMYDTTLLAGIGLTLGLMWASIKMFGLGGGFLGFFLGAILTGIIAAQSGVELGHDGCTRYSSYADDC